MVEIIRKVTDYLRPYYERNPENLPNHQHHQFKTAYYYHDQFLKPPSLSTDPNPRPDFIYSSNVKKEFDGVVELISKEKKITFIPPSWGNDILPFIPKREWYAKENHAEGVHGIDHATRVIINVSILARLNGISQRGEMILKAAASVHDTQRVNDRVDPGHGHRARIWTQHTKQMLIDNGFNFNSDEWQIIENLVEYHEAGYGNIPSEIKKQFEPLLSIFMDADKLERPRAPKRDWWPNISHFYSSVKDKVGFELRPETYAEKLLDTSKYFCLESIYETFRLRDVERRLVRKDAQLEAIRNVGLKIGYIRP